MQTQINCPIQLPPIDCGNQIPVGNLTCNQIDMVQSDIRAADEEFKPGPNNAIMFTPISFLPKGKGLADFRPTSGPLTKLPDSWSWCKDGGNKISSVANQGRCGSCWAVASTSALADRYGIKYNIEAPKLSYAWTILKIGTANGGPNAACQCSTGGSLAQAGCGFQSVGVVKEKCYPYGYISYLTNQRESGPVLPLDKLEDCCNDTDKSEIFTAQDNSTQNIVVLDSNGNVDVNATHMKLKAEIANNGPVAATFMVYQNFQEDYYPNHVQTAKTWDDVGIYYPNRRGNMDGGHAVVITGWGTKNGQEFWEVRNSWGTGGIPAEQGVHRGYFKYAIVDNDPCHLGAPGIEEGQIIGGAVSFMPGSLPNGYQSKPGSGKHPSPHNYGKFTNGNTHNFLNFRKYDGSVNWVLISIIVIVAILLVVLLVQLIPKKD